MNTRRRTRRGGGHGKPSRVQYRKSLRRLEQSILNANAAARATFNAARSSRRKGMSVVTNSMNVGTNVRRSSRSTIKSAALKSLRKRAAEQREKNMKRLAQSYQQVVKNAKAAQKAQTENELSSMMNRMGF